MIKTTQTRLPYHKEIVQWTKNIPLLVQCENEIVLATTVHSTDNSFSGVIVMSSNNTRLGKYYNNFSVEKWKPLPSGEGVIIENP